MNRANKTVQEISCAVEYGLAAIALQFPEGKQASEVFARHADELIDALQSLPLVENVNGPLINGVFIVCFGADIEYSKAVAQVREVVETHIEKFCEEEGHYEPLESRE